MNTPILFSFLAVSVVSVLPLASLRAASNATDNANSATYNGGSYSGLNGGVGFGINTVTGAGGNGGTFLGSASANGNGGSGGGIDTNGKSFGLFANNGALVQDTRSFTTGSSNNSTALSAGQTFSLGFDNGFIATNSTAGFNLLNSGGTSQITFQFKGGNADYTYSVGTGAQVDTGVGYTDSGLNISYAMGTGNAFSLMITPLVGATTTINGTLTAGATISQFQVFDNNTTGTDTNNGTNYNVYFNSPNVSGATAVPEPATWLASFVSLGLLIGLQRLRRPHLA